MPLVELPGFGVALCAQNGKNEELAELLRQGNPAVLSRLHNDEVVLDLRTVLNAEELEAFKKVMEPVYKEFEPEIGKDLLQELVTAVR